MLSLYRRGGFTLIELLIVIAIIAIIAGVAFVALDPLSRFQDARDAKRWSDVTAVLSGIKVQQVDRRGSYLWSITNATAGTNYQISNATTSADCNLNCSAVTAVANCINLQGLADDGYLASLPVSPNGAGSWTSILTGYYLSRNANGSITVVACDPEGGSPITVTR